MSLLTRAQDLTRKILNENLTGFALNILFKDPQQSEITVKGLQNKHNDFLDPETGTLIQDELCSVTVFAKDFTENSFSVPTTIFNENLKPWTFEFEDAFGNIEVFKVIRTDPDKTLGYLNVRGVRYYES